MKKRAKVVEDNTNAEKQPKQDDRDPPPPQVEGPLWRDGATSSMMGLLMKTAFVSSWGCDSHF